MAGTSRSSDPFRLGQIKAFGRWAKKRPLSPAHWWAALFALYLLTRLALFWRFPIFWDEGFLAVQAQTGLDYPIQRFSELADNKGPLQNWIATVFIGAGISPIDAVRLVSLLAGGAAMSAIVLIARRLAPLAGRVAGVLYVISPYFLVYDVHGLVDPLLSALLATALLLQIQQAEKPRLDRAFALGLVLGAALLTRNLGLLGLLLLPASLLAFDFRAADLRPRLARWAGCSVVSLVMAGLCHAVLYLSPLYYEQAQLHRLSGLSLQYRSLSDVLSSPFKYLSADWPTLRDALTGYIGLPLLAVAAGTTAVAFFRRQRLAILLVLWAGAPWIATLLFSLHGYARYALAGVPPLTALVAAGLMAIWTWLVSRRIDARIAALITAATLVPGLILDGKLLATPGGPVFPGWDNVQYSTGLFAGTGLSRIYAALDRLAGPGQTVVATVGYTPWNLAVQFDDPLRIPGGPVPYQDNAVVHSGRRKIFFVIFGTPGSQDNQFVFTYTPLGLPVGFNPGAYRIVATSSRPRQGTQPPVTAVLYQRIS